MSESVPCRRCGRRACDELPPEELDKLLELLRRLPRNERPDPDDLPPLI